jgi:hypothetical protein
VRADMGTAASQAVTAFSRRAGKIASRHAELQRGLIECADAFARDDLERGIALLDHVVRLLPAQHYRETDMAILLECAQRFEEFGTDRVEYLVIALHTLLAGWQP